MDKLSGVICKYNNGQNHARSTMSFLVKTSSVNGVSGNAIHVSEQSYYGGGAIQVGSNVFLWFSETAGGSGLAWRGIVEDIERIPRNRNINLTIRLTVRAPEQCFGVTEISPFRDINDRTPISELSRKLYKHAHNKIAWVSNDEVALLQTYFNN